MLNMTTLTMIALAMLSISLLVAAGFDVWRYEIPDTLTIIILAGAAFYGWSVPNFDWPSHLAAGGIAFAIGLFVFSRHWLGGGDVKLMTGCACWASLPTLFSQISIIAITGGALAILLLIARQVAAKARFAPDRLPQIFQPDAPLPYAVAIAIGMIIWTIKHLLPTAPV